MHRNKIYKNTAAGKEHRKKYFILCIDLEEFTLPLEFSCKNFTKKEQFEISYIGARNIESLLKKLQIKATFFVTNNMALVYPDLIKQLCKQGHEIALHFEPADNSADTIKKYKEHLEKVSGISVAGLKSHRFEPFQHNMLHRIKFLYNNSFHPTFVPRRYFNVFKTTKIHKEQALWNIPVSVTPILRLPFSWIWFRSMGINYAKYCSRCVYLSENFINIYFHSWDFENLSNYSLTKKLSLLLLNSGDKCIDYLNKYLHWLDKQGVIFVNFKDYLKLNDYC